MKQFPADSLGNRGTTMESKSELYKAMSKFQGEVKPAVKDKMNPHFRSNYASLESVWNAIRAPLAKNGLSVVQIPEHHEAGIALRTILCHDSGETVESVLVMPMQKKTPQDLGSALTYARRYGIATMLGIVDQDDDDGNGAARNGNGAHIAAQTGPEPAEAAQLRECTSADALKAAWGRLATTVDKATLQRLVPVKEDMKKQIEAAVRSEAAHA